MERTRITNHIGLDTAPPLLTINHLAVAFKTTSGIVPAAQDVSLIVREGETVGLIGESGSGKTVTAMCILRLLPASATLSSGEIWFGKEDLLRVKRRRLREIRGGEIGMIFQDPMTALNPVLTVGRQLSETLKTHRSLEGVAATKAAIDLLSMVEIPDAKRRATEYPHQFSGGMRQRAMIAMALSCRPRLLIADEPTTALDVTVQAQILELLERLKQDLGMAMLLITHDFGVVAGAAESINVMYAGRIVESGSVEQIFESPRHPYTEGLLKAIPKLGVAKDVKLDAVRGQPPEHLARLTGCPFHPRCPYVLDRCMTDDPPLVPVSNGHSAACWVDIRRHRR